MWCHGPTFLRLFGAKYSPPGDKFQKSGGPRARGPRPSEIQISEIKLYPNDQFSIIIDYVNAHSICVHPQVMSQITEVNLRHGFIIILEFLRTSTSWNQVMWSVVMSIVILVTFDTLGSLHTCSNSLSRSLVYDDIWWISGVLMWGSLEESASHDKASK